MNLGIVRLESGDTKNREGRTVYLDEELKNIFIEQSARRMSDTDLQAATSKQLACLETQLGTVSGTISDFVEKTVNG
jgi:hypothetical protein